MDVFENKLWLVKLPEQIYKQIANEGRKKTEVGGLDIYEGKDKKGFKIMANVELENGDSCSFDLDYQRLEENNLFAFSGIERARGVNILGKFLAANEKLSDILTENVRREEDSMKPSVKLETSKFRPQGQGLIKLSEYQYIATNDSREKGLLQRNRKEKNLKKTRKDKYELQTEIFKLFNEKKYWTKKELVSKLDQPENYLKDVLLEICTYIKSGPKKSCYELKSQFMSADIENN